MGPDLAQTFLATIAQSSAAIVAIIGGFLVSRLVALSSEREGMQRQVNTARHRLEQVTAEWDSAHEERVNQSGLDLEDDVLAEVVQLRFQTRTIDADEMLREHLPRNSSHAEMRPVLDDLVDRVDRAFEALGNTLMAGDDQTITLDDLQARGLGTAGQDEPVMAEVFEFVRDRLPQPPSSGPFGYVRPSIMLSAMTPAWVHETRVRRHDEAVAEESRLGAAREAATRDVERLTRELEQFAQPVGVRPAVWILAVFSLLGIVVPLLLMPYGPSCIEGWLSGLLLAGFALGLAAVLGYIWWYQRLVAARRPPSG